MKQQTFWPPSPLPGIKVDQANKKPYPSEDTAVIEYYPHIDKIRFDVLFLHRGIT